MPPFLLAFSVPLAALAALTTTMAFFTLFVRVLVVYIELALVIAHNQLFHNNHLSYPQPSAKGSSPSPTIAQQRRKKRRSSASSACSEPGADTPKALDSTTFGLITSAGIDRDFEGVGGWRFPGPDEEDTQWISSNTRLTLPAAIRQMKGKHSRSLTSGVISSPRSTGDWGTHEYWSKSPLQSRARTPQAATTEEYFLSHALSASTAALD